MQAEQASVQDYLWKMSQHIFIYIYTNIGVQEKSRVIRGDKDINNFCTLLHTCLLKKCTWLKYTPLISFFLCLSHTGDTANVLSGFLCGVSILAQGSDLKGHGVLVMPPRLTVPVCPQCVQTNKALGPF